MDEKPTKNGVKLAWIAAVATITAALIAAAPAVLKLFYSDSPPSQTAQSQPATGDTDNDTMINNGTIKNSTINF